MSGVKGVDVEWYGQTELTVINEMTGSYPGLHREKAQLRDLVYARIAERRG
jgi:hypothetical protein